MPRKRPGTKQPVRPGSHHLHSRQAILNSDGFKTSPGDDLIPGDAPTCTLLMTVKTGCPSLMADFIDQLDGLGLQIVQAPDGTDTRQEFGQVRSRKGNVKAPYNAVIEVRGLVTGMRALLKHPAIIEGSIRIPMSGAPAYRGIGATKAK